MKNIFLLSLVLSSSTLMASSKPVEPVVSLNADTMVSWVKNYTCYRYVSGHPTGTWITVKAETKSEAESIAYRRMKENGGRIDYAKCKY